MMSNTIDIAPFGWGGSVTDFVSSDVIQLVEALRLDHKTRQNESPSDSQVTAWRTSIQDIKSVLEILIESTSAFGNLGIVFEYELPRERGRRPDVLLINENDVIVLEFKGYSFAESSFVDQVSAYARDIKNYHAASHSMNIIPILVLQGG